MSSWFIISEGVCGEFMQVFIVYSFMFGMFGILLISVNPPRVWTCLKPCSGLRSASIVVFRSFNFFVSVKILSYFVKIENTSIDLYGVLWYPVRFWGKNGVRFTTLINVVLSYLNMYMYLTLISKKSLKG